ncbi:MAG: DNA polymerase I [Anaerolineae bacterium]|nr:DNA polymerase I [Anaerolineae bacterium]
MSDARPRLTLIDGHGLAYRQFFAPDTRHFSTTAGEPTNATYGFARALLDLLQADPPTTYLAVAFDQGMSGRETVYTEYKSTREKMPSEMVVQMARIRELIEAFNIPILEVPGCEADDVIGSVARQAGDLGVHVHIVTGDRDLLQLVSDDVHVELPGIRGSEPPVYTPQIVQQTYGIRPDQFIDYKGLVGDSSDNYPGVKGIGDKTAVPLLQQYGTLEGIYEHLGEIKGATQKKLAEGRENAFLSRQLATIITDLPVNVELEKCAAHDYDPARVDTLFEMLEFRSLRPRLRKGPRALAQANAPTPAEQQQMALFGADVEHELETPVVEVVPTIIVDDDEKLAAMVRELDSASMIAFDTETTSKDQISAILVGISLSTDGEKGYYIPVGHVAPGAGTLLAGETPVQLPLERVIEAIRPAMTDPAKAKVAHNAVYDLIVLRRVGLDVTPIAYDTMIAEWVARPDTEHKGLKDQARVRLGVHMARIDELIGRGKKQITMDQVPVERAAPYAAADAAITHRLVAPTRAELEAGGLWELFTEIEMPLVPIIADLDMTGALLDLPYLRTLSQEFAARLDEIKNRIYESVGQSFNIGSPKQLNEIFFDKLGLPTNKLRRSAHGYSVDADALEMLRDAHPAVGLILDWRGLEKLKSTYVDALPRMVDTEGRVHTSYNQTGAVTGRISSDTPNLQNIPIRTEEGRRVRKAFIAPPGHQLLGVDYSQVELRILAHYSEDEALIEAFRQDQDIHRATAALVFGVPFNEVSKEQRYFAKRVNFGLMYGMGAQRLARESGLSRSEAETFVQRYFARLPGVRAYLDRSRDLAREQGYLETLMGRRKSFARLADPLLGGGDRARLEREAINMPIQGTAADIIKIAMIRLSRRLRDEKCRARLILQVHDELVLEAPDDEVADTARRVREEMENALTLRVPLRAEANVGQNWAEMQPLEVWLAGR